MEKEWHPIATVPAQVRLELSIYDKSEYHALAFPCGVDDSGCRGARTNRLIPVQPTHWRLWDVKADRQ